MNDDPTVEQKEHVATRTPAEELIEEMYTMNIKGEPLGVYDDLTALNESQGPWVRKCLQQIFHVDIPLDTLLLHNNIDSLVNFLSGLWGGREIVEEIAWTFLQIGSLPDDDVKLQLAKELSTSGLIDGE